MDAVTPRTARRLQSALPAARRSCTPRRDPWHLGFAPGFWSNQLRLLVIVRLHQFSDAGHQVAKRELSSPGCASAFMPEVKQRFSNKIRERAIRRDAVAILVRVLILAACFKNEREIRAFTSVPPVSRTSRVSLSSANARSGTPRRVTAIRGAAFTRVSVRVFQEPGKFTFFGQFTRFPQLALTIPLQHPVSNIIRRIETTHFRATGPRRVLRSDNNRELQGSPVRTEAAHKDR